MDKFSIHVCHQNQLDRVHRNTQKMTDVYQPKLGSGSFTLIWTRDQRETFIHGS